MIGGLLINFYIGSFYLWGNIAIYVLSYFHQTDTDMSYNFIFLVDAFMVLANWLGNMLGTTLFQDQKISTQCLIALGGFGSLAGIFLASYTTNFYWFLLCYAGVQGVGAGMCYMAPLICGWEWYPDRKGLVSGVMVAGYGFSSFIFSLVSMELVNPNDEAPHVHDKGNAEVTYFDGKVANRVPSMLRTLVIIWFALVSLSLCLV